MKQPIDLQAGYAQTIITPSIAKTVYLAGFGQNRIAQSVHDDLYARGIAVQADEKNLVIVALDLLGLPRHYCQSIETEIQKHHSGVHVILACTHVHHGPDTLGLWGPDSFTAGVDGEYMDFLRVKVIEVALQAIAQKHAAEMKSVSVMVSEVAKNARDPNVKDEELSCLQFCDPKTGKVIVTCMVYPCHPEVLWDGNTHITSDYAYTLRGMIESATEAPALFMVGALGGMMTPDVVDHSFSEAAVMGNKLAEAGLEALSTTQYQPVDCFSVERKVFTIPLQSFLLEQAVKAGLLPDTSNQRGEIFTEVNLVKIGSTWIVTVPGELLPRLGLLIKQQLKQAGATQAVVIGLANDEIGYILPADEYVYPDNPFEPGAHYEETMSVGPQAAPRLMSALAELLKKG